MPDEQYRLIPLKSGAGMAVVDEADARSVGQYRWWINTNGYAVRAVQWNGKPRAILMHREILGLEYGDGLEVDHINWDKLDNRRCNLRIVTSDQQKQNRPSHRNSTSQFRNVHWEASKQKWRVRPRVNGIYHNLGHFADEVEAAEVAEAWRAENMPYAEPDPILARVLAERGEAT